MATDLGTYFVIGPSSNLINHIINNLGGRVLGFRTKRELNIMPAIGLHFCNSEVLKSKICLLEFSRLNEIGHLLTSSQLLCLLQSLYFKALSKGITPKGFIVTASGYNDRLKVFGYLEKFFAICGRKVKLSTVVLAERLSINQQQDNLNQNIIFERCESLGIACVSWFSDVHLLTKESANKQVSDFTEALNDMQPFFATWMTELLEEIKKSPKIEVVSIIKEESDSEDDETEIDLDEMRNRLRSVSKVGTFMYFKFCELTREGVIKQARRAFGLKTDEASLPLVKHPMKNV